MQALYNEEMFASLRGQIKKRRIIAFLVLLVFLAAAVWTLILDDHKESRPILATTLLVIAGGCSFIFLWDLTVHPLNCYARHMDAALHGRTHQISAVFDRVGTDDSLVDGVAFRDLIFLGDPDDISQAFGIEPRDNTLFLPGVMSRKKQIIPPLSEAVKCISK